MTYEEVKQRLSEMESRFDDGFSSLDRNYLDSIYFQLFGRGIKNKGCSDCYRDAYIEIKVKLKTMQAMPKKSEFVLKAGAIITFFGEQQCYSNSNITDEAALRFLSLNPRNEKLFEKLPENWRSRIKTPEAETIQAEESEKDALIARLTAENEELRKENESLKAGSTSKKRKKKTEPDVQEVASDATAEDVAPYVEETSVKEQPSDAEPSIDGEVSVEE